MDKIIEEAIEKFADSQEGSGYNRRNAERDIKFGRLGEQWPQDIKDQRAKEARPCLTINRLPAFIRQVLNDARQNKPSIKVRPVDNGADPDTAEVLDGLIRSIERRSNAWVAYNTAMDHQVSGGFGFFRLCADYVNEYSFDQELLIKRIPNPLMVHWDIDSMEFDSSDWNYAFVSEFLTDEEYKARWPKATSLVDFESDMQVFHEDYVDEDRIQVAEYWTREDEIKRLIRFSNGQVAREDQLTEQIKEMLQSMEVNPSGMDNEALIQSFMEINQVEIQEERDVECSKVARRMINGVEVLEEEDWQGSQIPVFPVWGEEVIIDGRRYFRSLIRDAMDPQKMFNYWRSASTELVALAPKAPFIGPKGFIPNNETDIGKWETANTRSHGYLEYEGPVAPQRQAFAGVPAGVLQEALNAADDMKAIMGIFDSSLGARSNETSGKAILARQRESDVSNFHFVDNLNRALQSLGKCLVELIPHYYSARQSVRILGEDSKEKVINLTTGEETKDQNGKKLYNLSVGTYDVEVKTGPAYSTKREETREMLIEIMRAVPGAAPYMADMIADHMDFAGADKFANRAKMMLPPEIQKAEAEEMAEDLPPEMQQIMMQAQQQIQGLQQQIQQMQAEMQPERDKMAMEQNKLQQEGEFKNRELSLKEREIDIKEKQGEISEIQAYMAEIKDMIANQPKPEGKEITLQNFSAPEKAEEENQLKGMIVEAVQNLAKVSGAPVRIVRDPETGAIVGAEKDVD